MLSPMLFLIVIDPLLSQLQESSLGLSVNNMLGDSCMQTMATSNESLEKQVAIVKDFNVQKCEVVMLEWERVVLVQSVRWMGVCYL